MKTPKSFLAIMAILYAGIVAACIALIWLGWSEPARANERWALLTTNATGTTYEIDTVSLKKVGDTITYWARVSSMGKTKGESDIVVMQKTEINCSRMEIRITYATAYIDGKLEPGARPMPWAPVVPDSIGETVALRGCADEEF